MKTDLKLKGKTFNELRKELKKYQNNPEFIKEVNKLMKYHCNSSN